MNTSSTSAREKGDVVRISTISSIPWWEQLNNGRGESVAAATQGQCQSQHGCGNGQCNVQFIERASADKSAR